MHIQLVLCSAELHGAALCALSPRDEADRDGRSAHSRLAANDPAARAFLFWSRMPIADPGPKGILLKDQRFEDNPARGPFSVLLKPDR